jgi:hypothetical protein
VGGGGGGSHNNNPSSKKDGSKKGRLLSIGTLDLNTIAGWQTLSI